MQPTLFHLSWPRETFAKVSLCFAPYSRESESISGSSLLPAEAERVWGRERGISSFHSHAQKRVEWEGETATPWCLYQPNWGKKEEELVRFAWGTERERTVSFPNSVRQQEGERERDKAWVPSTFATSTSCHHLPTATLQLQPSCAWA